MKTTGQKDKKGKEIFVGDILRCDHGYMITVFEEDKKFLGKLICEKGNSCENIPYALNAEISVVVAHDTMVEKGLKPENI